MTPAEEIYVVLGDQKRISRYFRAEWLLRQYVQSRQPQQQLQEEYDQISNNLKLVSSVPPVTNGSDPVVSASTPVYFLADSHAFAFLLDLSHSQRTVDTVTSSVLFDDVFTAFSAYLRALVRSFKVPGSDFVYTPTLYVSVLCCVPSNQLNRKKPLQVLVQGRRLTSETVDVFLTDLQGQVARLETTMYRDYLSSQPARTWSVEFGLADMIRSCMLALQLLPSAVGGMVIVSDGVCELPDANTTDTLLSQLRSLDIACSFLKVGDEFHPHTSFGFVPNTDLLRFIAEASGGAYLPVNFMELEETLDCDELAEINVYQTLMLCQTIQAVDPDRASKDLCYLENQQFLPAPMRKRYSEEKIQIDFMRFVGSRVREGFQLRDIYFTKRDTQLEVKIVLPWKDEVKLEYHIVAPWPVSQADGSIQVSLVVEASYDFLVDITAKKALGSSPFRSAVVKRFLQTVRTVQLSDQLMIHLQSFSSVSANHSIPQSARDGIPLFYLQPGSSNPVLSQGVASPGKEKGKKSKVKHPISHFATFWRPVTSLDTSVWHRWFHIYQIAVQLEYDVPLPKHLHVPNANGRFSVVQCRQAAGILYSVLTEWATFVLLENHSYIRFITSGPEADSSPSHFCLARLTQKAPHMVVRLAFVAGTPPETQFEIVEDMRAMLNKLVVERHTPRKPVMSVTLKGRQTKLVSQETISRSCAIVLNKVPERILVRYDKVPTDLTSPQRTKSGLLNASNGTGAILTTERASPVSSVISPVMHSLENYLHHKRWIWRLHPDRSDHESSSLGVTAVGHMLSALLQLRLREGFHIANSGSGIVFLIKELEMQAPGEFVQPCLVQCILFPPLACCRGSTAEHSQTYSGVDISRVRELHVVTETWIEPQCGVCVNCSPAVRHLEGLDYREIVNEIHRSSMALMSTLCTYEQLFLMCCHPGLRPPPSRLLPDGEADAHGFVERVPLLFDVCALLRQTRQVELLFSGFSGRVSLSELKNAEAANARLLTVMLQKLGAFCESEFVIVGNQAAQLTGQIQLRCSGKDRRHDQLNWLSENRNWTCFLKPAGENRLFVVLVPDCFAELPSDSLTEEVETVTAIPLYLYECHQSVVSGRKEEAVAKNVTEIPRPDAEVFEDLTFVKHNPALGVDTSEIVNEAACCFKEPGRRTSRIARNASVSDLLSGMSVELANFLEHVKDICNQSLVEATFVSLQNGDYVDSSNVNFAVELCEEGQIEIDLTDFLRAICIHFSKDRQVKTDSSDASSPVLEKTVSLEEYGDGTSLRSSVCSHSSICRVFGNTIEVQFGSILASNFVPVPTNQEFFYLSPGDLPSRSSTQSSRNRSLLLSGSECAESTDVEFTDGGNRLESRADSEGFEEVFTQDAADDEVEVAFLGSTSVPTTEREEEEEEEDNEDHRLPLFISFICLMKDKRTGDIHVTVPLQSIPTCLERIVERLEVSSSEKPQPPDLGSLDVSVTLDVTMFTLPQQESRMIFERSRLSSDSTQGTSPPSPDHGRVERRLAYRPLSPSFSDNSEEDEQVLDPLGHLSEPLRNAVEDLRDQIAWLMKDEIIAAARTVVPITSATLEKVVSHIQSSKMASCQFVRVPLLFVYGAEQSMHRFIQEFESMSITGYNLNKVEKYYYLSEDRPLSRRWHLKNTSVNSSLDVLDSQLKDVRKTLGDATPGGYHDSLQLRAYSSQASVGATSVESVATYDGTVGEGSEDDSSVPYPVRLIQEDGEGHAIAACSDLWLILRISSTHVDIYFHSRYSEMLPEDNEQHCLLREMVESEVKSKCCQVNQAMLLVNLLEKRTCHHLLLSESKENTWALGHTTLSSSPLSFNYNTLSIDPRLDAINALPPGHFQCDEQFRTHIPLHWRLTGGPGTGTASGLQAAHSALSPFAVTNRKNMYVYQERGGVENIFYIRLSESMCLTESVGPSNRAVLASQLSVDIFGSRASSLSLRGVSEYEDDGNVGGSFYRRPSLEPDESQVDQSVVVEVYGIAKPGPDIIVELVGVLKKKVESSLLRILTAILSRNPNTKLDIADIQFIQPLGMMPTAEFSFCLPNIIPIDHRAFLYYMRQHLLQFVIAPNYQTLSPESQFRYAPCVPEPRTALPYDCVFVYCRPPTAATEGLACIYVQLSGFECSSDEEECTFDITQHDINDLIVVTESESTTATGGISIVRFQLWERGDVGREGLKKVLVKCLENALFDYLMEYYVLLMPLTPLPSIQPKETETTNGDELETEKLQEWAIVTISHPKPGQSQDLALKRDGALPSGADVVFVRPLETEATEMSKFERRQSLPLSGSYKEESGEEPDAESESLVERSRSHSMAIETPAKKRDQESIKPEARQLRRIFSEQTAGQLSVPCPVASSSGSLPKDVQLLLQTALGDHTSGSPIVECPGHSSKAIREVPVWLAKEMQRRRREWLYEVLEKAAVGETGTLMSVFWEKSIQVMNHACQKESSNTRSINVTLLNRYAVDYVLKEIVRAVPTFFPGTFSRTFKMAADGQSYLPYTIGRAKIESTNDAESSMDESIGTKLPLGSQTFIITGRNVENWKYTTEALSGVIQANRNGPSKQQQKFMPFDVADRPSGQQTFLSQDRFIPRQKFFLFHIQDKEITFYAYNCPGELNGRVERFLNRLSEWQNTRSRFLDFLLGQKMGLFHHFRATSSSGLREPAAVLKRTSSDLDQLVRETVPPLKEASQREKRFIYGTSSKSTVPSISHSSRRPHFPRSVSPNPARQSPTPNLPRSTASTSRAPATSLDDFDGLYREIFPKTPLCQSPYFSHSDPVKRHGHQALELKAYQKKVDSRSRQLLDILDTWQSRSKQKTAISMDLLVVLKNTARLIHYCNTPLLLSRKWRKTLMVTSSQGEATDIRVKDDHEEQCDHAVPAEGNRRETARSVELLTIDPDLGFDGNEEAHWHQCIRYAFMSDYVAYLEQQLGFSTIDVKPGSTAISSIDSGKEASPSPFVVSKLLRTTSLSLLESKCLQKTLAGGLILIELSFQDSYFSVRLYALEASRVRRNVVLNAQMGKLFTDECSHLKDLTHVHSFAYDFHLRQVRNFLCSQPGVQSLLPSGYPLMDFLEDFSTLCACPPSYIRNRLLADDLTVSIPVTTIAEDLFRYLLANSGMYGLTTLETNVNQFSAPASPCEPIWTMPAGDKLVLMKAKDCLLLSKKRGFQPGICQSDIEFHSYVLVSQIVQDLQMVSLDSTELQGSSYELHLRFYLLLISRHDIFPRLTLASPRGWRQSIVRMIGSSSTSRNDGIELIASSPGGSSPQMGDSLDDDIGSDLPFAPAPILDPIAVGEQVTQVKQLLDNAIRLATRHCRRDFLWKRLLFGYNRPGSGKKEGRDFRPGSSDKSNSQTDQGGLVQLAFDEFEELLCLVSMESLDSLDERLGSFTKMKLDWYHGLVSGLTTRFSDQIRAFKRGDGTTYHLTIPSPDCHDAFILLTLRAMGAQSRAEFSVVYRKSKDQWSTQNRSDETGNDQEQACRVMIESVVNFICFHMWTLLCK